MSTQDLPQDLQEQIEACKEHQRQRPDAPADPPVFVVEACGETLVCMPPSFDASQRLQKLAGAVQNDKREFVRYLETYVAETIFWIRGQSGAGQKTAIDHARKVAKSNYQKFDLLLETMNQVVDQIGTGIPVSSSKKY